MEKSSRSVRGRVNMKVAKHTPRITNYNFSGGKIDTMGELYFDGIKDWMLFPCMLISGVIIIPSRFHSLPVSTDGVMEKFMGIIIPWFLLAIPITLIVAAIIGLIIFIVRVPLYLYEKKAKGNI